MIHEKFLVLVSLIFSTLLILALAIVLTKEHSRAFSQLSIHEMPSRLSGCIRHSEEGIGLDAELPDGCVVVDENEALCCWEPKR